jgi:4-hydroxy-2-oxoglutarate aldolase
MSPDRKRQGLSLDLSGVLIPAATPFDPVTGDLDVVGLRSNLRRWLEHPVRGIVIGGSTGEAVLLEREERVAALEAARGLVPTDRLLVAGTGAESTRGTVRLTRDAADAGADAALVQPPAYYRGAMTSGALRDHYRAVADASPIPVILYQVPLRFSTVELATGLVAELSEHPNIVGVKDSRGDLALLSEYLTASRPGFQVLVGNGAKLYASLEMGAVGGILGVANLLPGESAALCAAFHAGRSAEAGRIQEQVAPVHDAVVGALGVPGVKRALDLLGYHGGAPRPPLVPLGSEGTSAVRAALERAGALPAIP